ncbi:MAG: anthranilate phosphoribosyltransferase [Saprospiraceae bacterium]|nr:anthranilate phosphoribosyltransferase [Saprospiraceae bacterium]|tara:strand:+ start:1699 stop:2700 length:1002 start_codon:yes stop_codon:yes gene_type:complete
MKRTQNIKETLHRLVNNEILTKNECKDLITAVGKGEVNEYQTTALLMAYQMRDITGSELSGFREGMIELSKPIDFLEFDTIDIVGTGGDGKNTFNISTLSAVVVAGAGYKVAKHGNSGKSSVSGSSNVLEHFGYTLTNDQDKLRRDLDQNNFCHMHAPLFHPAMKYVGAIRKGLGVGTFFNMLGPLLNPSRPKRQISGVWAPFIMPLYKQVFEDMGSEYAVVFSEDGYDEISLTGGFKIMSNSGEESLMPSDLNMTTVLPSDIFGGDSAKDAADIFLNILKGKGSESQNAVIHANAGYAIQRFKPGVDVIECIEEAKESLISGKALEVLNGFN